MNRMIISDKKLLSKFKINKKQNNFFKAGPKIAFEYVVSQTETHCDIFTNNFSGEPNFRQVKRKGFHKIFVFYQGAGNGAGFTLACEQNGTYFMIGQMREDDSCTDKVMFMSQLKIDIGLFCPALVEGRSTGVTSFMQCNTLSIIRTA